MPKKSPETAGLPIMESFDTSGGGRNLFTKPQPSQSAIKVIVKKASRLNMLLPWNKSRSPSEPPSPLESPPTQMDFSVRGPGELPYSSASSSETSLPRLSELAEEGEDVQGEETEQPMKPNGGGFAGLPTEPAPFVRVHGRLESREHRNPLGIPTLPSSQSIGPITKGRQRGETRRFLTGDGIQELIDREAPNEADRQKILRGLLEFVPPGGQDPSVVHALLLDAGIALVEWPPHDEIEPDELRNLYDQRQMISPNHFKIGLYFYVKYGDSDVTQEENCQVQEPNISNGNYREYSFQDDHSGKFHHAAQMGTDTDTSKSYDGCDTSDCVSDVNISKVAQHCAAEGQFQDWYYWVDCYCKGQYNINNLPDTPKLSNSYKFLAALNPPDEEDRSLAASMHESLYADGSIDVASLDLNRVCQDLQTNSIILSIFKNKYEFMSDLLCHSTWTPLDRCNSLNAHAIYDSSMMVVLDARKDWRFRCNPFVATQGIGFLAAQPLITLSGDIWGVISISGSEPRKSFTHAHRNILAEVGRKVTKALDRMIDPKRASCGEPCAQAANHRGHFRQVSEIDKYLIPPGLNYCKSKDTERFPEFDLSSRSAGLGMPHGKNNYSQDSSHYSLPSSRQFRSVIESDGQFGSPAKASARPSMAQLDTEGGHGFNKDVAHDQAMKDSVGHDLTSSNQRAGKDNYAFNAQSESTTETTLPSGHQSAADAQGDIIGLTPAFQSGYKKSFLDKANSLCSQALDHSKYDDIYIAEISVDENNPTLRKVVFVGKTDGAKFLTFANLELLDKGLKQDRVVQWQYDVDDPKYHGYSSGDVLFVSSADSSVSRENRTVGFVAAGLRHGSSPNVRSHELTALAKLKAGFSTLLDGSKQRASRRQVTTHSPYHQSHLADEATLVTALSHTSLRTNQKHGFQQRH